MAQTSFKWANLASRNAGVTVIVVGLAQITESFKNLLSDGHKRAVERIGPYLVPNSTQIVSARRSSINLPQMLRGNIPADQGHLLLSAAELKNFPELIGSSAIRPFYGAAEIVTGVPRWVIWTPNAPINGSSFSDSTNFEL